MAQPKYQLLQQWLRDQINSGEYTANQQIPTELELAEQFGYSRQTIRQAISGLEQEGLLKRTPGRGTFVCRQNAGRVNRSESRTRRVGVLTTYLDDYIFPGIINGIERVLSRHDYLFTLGLMDAAGKAGQAIRLALRAQQQAQQGGLSPAVASGQAQAPVGVQRGGKLLKNRLITALIAKGIRNRFSFY